MSNILEKAKSTYNTLKQTAKEVIHECIADTYDATAERSLSNEKLTNLLEETPFAALLPYELYDYERSIYYNKGALSIALEVIPLCGLDQEAFSGFVNLINEKLPDEAIIHFLMFSTDNIHSQLNRFKEYRSRNGGVYEELATKRAEYISANNETSVLKTERYILKNFKLYVDITIDPSFGEEKLVEIRQSLCGVLSGVGSGYRNLDPAALSMLVRSWTSAHDGNNEVTGLNPYDPINMQCHEPGMSFKIGKSRIYVNEGESVIKACSIKEYPTKWHPMAMGDMIGDPFKSALRLGFPFAISCTVFVPKQDVLIAKYTTKRTNTQNNAKSIGRFSRKTNETAKDLDMMMKLSEEGQKLVKISFDYLVFGNKDNIDENYTALTSFLDSKKWRYSDSKYTQLHAFLRALPMGINHNSAKAMGRFSSFKTMPAQTAINLLPMQGEALGSESPAMLFGGRRGQVCFWDPFMNQQGNYNVIVAASSGAGKSVFNQEYILSHISAGGRAWIIDVGRSYYKLTKLLGGEFIEFSPNSNISLNPFSDIDDIHDKEASYMDLLKPLVAQMASPYQQLSQVQLSEIEQAILTVWDLKGSVMTMTDVADQLLTVNDSRANDLGKMLFPYTKKGMYGHYFEGRSSFSFKNKLVCLELEELKSKEDLKSVVLMLLMFQMTQSMYMGDRKTRTTCLIDEAWDMLKNIQGSKFIETGCRRARKYNGNFVICTQSINDCFDNKASLEAYNNSDWTVLLRHRDTALTSLVQNSRIGLSDHALALAKSLENRSGDFSESLIKGPGGAFLGRLILDPFSVELFSTKADDFVKLNSLIASGHSMDQALIQMVLGKVS